jgi:putative CocE/NonD family hydrolase
MAENLRAPGVYKPEFNRFVLNLPLRISDRIATGRSIDFYQKALDHPAYDWFWKNLSTREKIDRVRVPVFSVGGWYDNFVESDLEAFRLMRKNGRIHRILIGPWPHNMSYDFSGFSFGPEGKLPILRLQLDWFDYWLKGTPEAGSQHAIANPPARIFVMGANRWRDEEEWPLSRARVTPFYLASRGRANSAGGDGRLQRGVPRSDVPDRYVYDPANPTPTAGGAVCCNPRVFPWGPMDQRAVEKRPDVLVYTGPALKRPVEVTGPIRAVLYVSTSQPDTDFTVKLVDVYPDGRAINLTDGILRLRYRESLEKPELARAGEVYAITIDGGVTSNEFGKGHRIRVEISSSNFPRFDRNPNTGRPVANDKELRRAAQTVFHDRARASHVLLPVVPQPIRGSRGAANLR